MSLYVFCRSLRLLPVLAVLVVGLIFQEMKETKPEKTGHVCCESCEFLPKA